MFGRHAHRALGHRLAGFHTAFGAHVEQDHLLARLLQPSQFFERDDLLADVYDRQ